ncbi:uncharacterized protein LOC111298415 isoform X1 [Durio zibethinus]|uniref:Uncharacterized protein LOC111298415 isoform X1 n=1 Tax=Durio zibethinus TaxID=66656 RepID=A0A6P5Z8Q4_DURZI|nr:uncharacterized protein LOC111298415 isoform X1 [Durio zibethinus]
MSRYMFWSKWNGAYKRTKPLLFLFTLMESQELPECPVCLQPYDEACTIPRVLACGHTVCELCLATLPQKLPGAIRCPACTVLVKYPPEGPKTLPKNIDLLRLFPGSENPRKPVQNSPIDSRIPFLPRSWSDEFYSIWKKYLLPDDAVERKKVSLLTVGSFSRSGQDGSGFKAGCLVRVMDCLSEMKEEEREELGLVLRAFTKQSGRICRFLGLWGDLGDGILYLVSEKQESGNFLDKNVGGFEKDGVFNFAMIGMEMCEAVISLHKEGLFAGCLGYSCFQFDDFGHVFLDLNEVLLIGRRIHDVVAKVGSSGKKIGDGEIGVLLKDLLKRDVFVSPETLLELLEKEGIGVDSGSSRYPIGYNSDVWLLGCILLRILLGEVFSDLLVDFMCHIVLKVDEDSESACSSVYTSLMENVSSLLGTKFGSEHVSLQQTLCKCLDFDPENRSLVRDVWKFIRELVIKPQFDKIVKFDRASYDGNRGRCLVIGKLCLLPRERTETQENDESKGNETNGADMVNGLIEGSIKSKDLQGHLDCVTGLAVARGYLFSSSFDKSVKVWSLQDYSHLHTFTGHEHKVMAVVCVDEEQPLCISGDSGGGIYVWCINIPFREEPLKKWYEEKDWRYSGIHALAVSENGYLYTGSGDKLIKEWSLQDGTLSCTMSGHKSVVSTLAVSNGVLHSGSWDGTVRLWSLSDHSLLTVIGSDTPGTVLSLAADQNTVVVTYENGSIKIWRDDVFRKSIQIHNGAIFAISLKGKWLFTGSWDRTIKAQELAGDDFDLDVRVIGSIPCDSVITALSYCEGKLFVGFGDRTLKNLPVSVHRL